MQLMQADTCSHLCTSPCRQIQSEEMASLRLPNVWVQRATRLRFSGRGCGFGSMSTAATSTGAETAGRSCGDSVTVAVTAVTATVVASTCADPTGSTGPGGDAASAEARSAGAESRWALASVSRSCFSSVSSCCRPRSCLSRDLGS